MRTIVFDVGNSYLKIGFFIDDKMQNWFSQPIHQVDEQFLDEFWNQHQIQKNECVVLGSVVVSKTKTITQYFEKHNQKYVLIENTMKFSFSIDEKMDINKIGRDILASCEYVSGHFNSGLVFIFGTAAVCLKILNKKLISVSIAPGVGLSFRNLLESADGLKNKEVDLKFYNQNATNTINALQSGLFHILNGFVRSHKMNLSENENEKITKIIISGGDVLDKEVEGTIKIENVVLKGYYEIFKLNYS